MQGQEDQDRLGIPSNPKRRSFLSKMTSLFMLSGLAASYGTFIHYMGRFLYPAGSMKRRWLFLTQTGEMKKGDSLQYRSPTGEKIAVARQGTAGSVDDFIALSSTCPHLGCQVHWEGQKNRFFCPCHNGAFNPKGEATEGPPAEAKQNLPKYPLKIEKGLLYIYVPVEQLTPDGSILKIPSGGHV